MEIVSEDLIYAMNHICCLFFSDRQNFDVHGFIFSSSVVCTVTASGKTHIGTSSQAIFYDGKLKNAVKLAAYIACRKFCRGDVPWGILTGIRPARPVRLMLEEGRSEQEIHSILTEQLKLNPKKAALSMEIAHRQGPIIRQSKGISLFINIPFCPSRCLYCSFTTTSNSRGYIDEYLNKLIDEINYVAHLIEGNVVDTIYIGGGTPTILSPEQLECLFLSLERWRTKNLMEFTVEAGRPDTISAEKLHIMKAYGVNRICINAQSMNDDTLRLIGRNHSQQDVYEAFSAAHKEGFKNINTDVIVGLPSEHPKHFEHTLNSLMELEPFGITVHTMYIKRASRLKQELSDHSFTTEASQMLDFAYSSLKRQGYNPYYIYRQKATLGNLENVGYSKEGFECLYNVYMMEDTDTVVGIGAGAVTKLVDGTKVSRIFNVKEPKDYILRFDQMLQRKAMQKYS